MIISPFNPKHLNPVSVDLTLAPEFKIYKKETVVADSLDEIPLYIRDKKAYKVTTYTTDGYDTNYSYEYERPLIVKEDNPVEFKKIPKHGFLLEPGEVYLYACNEHIGVKGNIRAKVEGKSSLGRLGLFVHVTAGFIDPGFEGSLVLELVATRPLVIFPHMKICQVEFAYVSGEIQESYDMKPGSKYMNQTGVQESKMHLNFQQGQA